MGAALMVSPGAAEPVALAGRAMGTTWAVKFVPATDAREATSAEEIKRRVAARLEELEQLFSTYRPSSTVSRFNALRSTEWIAVPQDVVTVAAIGREISELTGGAFDATVAPLLALWGFGPEGRQRDLPTEVQVVAVRGRVGWERLELRTEPPALRKAEASLAVDFSSVAKGFASDALSELLVSLGAETHLVQVGGDVKTSGARRWRVGVERPEAGGVAAVVELPGGKALSTSGNGRNAIERAGRRLGHIIDPRTGRPVESEVLSVSVVHDACARSSALATGLLVLGLEDGLRLARREGWAVLFLVRRGAEMETRATAEFEALIVDR